MKTEKEIYKQIDAASDLINEGGKYFGMTYEDGVKSALEWVVGDMNELPIEE